LDRPGAETAGARIPKALRLGVSRKRVTDIIDGKWKSYTPPPMPKEDKSH